MLLDHGADVNEGAPPPIVRTVELEYTTMFGLLIERGAILDMPETGGEAVRRAKVYGLESRLTLLEIHGVPLSFDQIRDHLRATIWK